MKDEPSLFLMRMSCLQVLIHLSLETHFNRMVLKLIKTHPHTFPCMQTNTYTHACTHTPISHELDLEKLHSVLNIKIRPNLWK